MNSLSTFKQLLKLYDANLFSGLHASINTSFQALAALNEKALVDGGLMLNLSFK